MVQRTLAKQITLGIVTSVFYIATVVLTGIVVGGCTNPVKDTYGKGVEGGKKSIEKAKGVQDEIDESTRKTQEQEKQAEGSE